MSNVTIQLSDELVKQAKAAGVFNEQALAELCEQFLRTHIRLAQTTDTTQDKQTTINNQTANQNTQTVLDAKQMNQRIADMFNNWDS